MRRYDLDPETDRLRRTPSAYRLPSRIQCVLRVYSKSGEVDYL